MPSVYTSSTFPNAYEYKRRRVVPAFRDDPSLGKIITRYYEVRDGTYTDPVLDTVDSEFPTAYLTNVRPREHRDGEIMRYEVDFCTIPARRELDFEGYGARFPGFGVASTANAAKTVYGFVPSADRKTAILHVPAHGYTVNTVVGYHLVLASGNQQTGQFSMQGHSLVVQSALNQLTVLLDTPVPAGVPVNFFAGTVRNFSVAFPARSEVTEEVKGRVVYDYFLPGVSSGIARADDIPLPQRFRIFGSDGAETSTLSTTTHPTQAQYEAMVVGGQSFLAQVIFGRWRGNIWERGLRTVRAI